MKLKQLTLLLAFIGAGLAAGGCGRVWEFAQYGACDDAAFRVTNNTPRAIAVSVGGDPKRYEIGPGNELLIPGRYPIFSRTYVRIPVTATVIPHDPMIRGGGTTWNFNHNGHSLYGGRLTTGREVHAMVELSNPRPDAKTNSLVFRVYQ